MFRPSAVFMRYAATSTSTTIGKQAFRQNHSKSSIPNVNMKTACLTGLLSLTTIVGLLLVKQPIILSEQRKFSISPAYEEAFSKDHEEYSKMAKKERLNVVANNPTTSPKSSSSKLYKRGQVAAHNSESTGIWVTYQNGVYDISEFVKIHPGGEKILLAAGKAIDPFWAIFSIHNSKESRELLEGYRIGDLLPIDQDETSQDVASKSNGLELLFANEPSRDPSLIVHSARPCNAESALENLNTFITPNTKFYVRNHLPVPQIDEEAFKLEVEGPGIMEGTRYSIEQLKKDFPQVSVIVTLQCAGNRRKEMHAIKPVKGLQWGGGAISNAVWTGVRLSDILKASGYRAADLSASAFPGNVQHVHLDGAEGYGASIPVEKALDPRGDVILAYEMNGEPIPADHGYPLRAVVPGTVAARSVKWVSRIALDEDESPSHWQQRDYKGFSPSADLASSDYSTAESIQELPVQSSFTLTDGDTLVADKDGIVTVKGYAIAGGGRGINRVDVSADGGKTWRDANLSKPSQPRGRNWAWTQWSVQLPTKRADELNLVCKAVDSSYNTQPDGFDGVYNARGVLVSAWQKLKVKVRHS